MNITLQTTDKLNGVVTAVVEPADYQENVKKAIKEFRKNADMPGFRKGMVPEGLIRKKYGTSILAEEMNKLLQSKLYEYIRENKINMLGELMPTEGNDKIELVDGNTFTFTFDIAIAPEIKVELSAKDKLPYFQVEVEDKVVDAQVQMYRQRGGNYEKVDSYEDNDMVKGAVVEVDKKGNPVEGGVTAEGVVMLPKYFKNDKQKKLFEKAKTNDVITFNPAEAYDNSEAELASLLKIEKEQVAEHKGDFQFTISEITRYVPGPLNQELFDQVFPGGEVKSAEDFSAKIKSQLQEQYDKDADYRFLGDLRNYLFEKVGEVEFPDEKIKKIMKANAKNEEEVEANYQKNIESLKWHLIKEQLVEQNQIKVEDTDVIDMAREVTKMQFAQYGLINIPEEYINNSVNEMLKKRETVDNLIDRSIEMKLAKALKEIVKLNVKKVSVEEFNKMP
ncbi:MAG: trigger factor [Bacteroidaceae bacterium]|jgi:trigger factor|nr:trigger factor [Bacteroidaceae bacterium]